MAVDLDGAIAPRESAAPADGRSPTVELDVERDTSIDYRNDEVFLHTRDRIVVEVRATGQVDLCDEGAVARGRHPYVDMGRAPRMPAERRKQLAYGDARSNHREPQVGTLRRIHARSRRVYLLNPEPEADWNTTDSIVDAYRSGLDGVFEVRNLRQLGEAVLRIT